MPAFATRTNDLRVGWRRSMTADLDWRPPSFRQPKGSLMPTRTQLRIEVSDPQLAQSLSGFLEHSIYQPAPPEGEIVSVTVPEGLSPELARAEIDLYLRAWRRLHPEVAVSLVD
jgi:hypothetical protein